MILSFPEMMDGIVDVMTTFLNTIKNNVDYSLPSFQISILLILASPTFWNLFGRLEHNYRIFRKIFFGNKYVACYIFSIMVFSLSALRNFVYKLAIEEQPFFDFGFDPLIPLYLSYLLYAIGTILVVGSTIRLGIIGTYCGDYFGILMKERITGFPFSIVEGTRINNQKILTFH